MDEATSALDFETERELCLNLQRWSKGRTVFFITHRLTTIRSADVILLRIRVVLLNLVHTVSLYHLMDVMHHCSDNKIPLLLNLLMYSVYSDPIF